MINIFIPQKKGRIKTNIRGFWLSPSGQICYDYLRIEEHSQFAFDSLFLDRLKKKYNQEALFLTDYEGAYIYTDYDKIKVLKERSNGIITNLKKEIKHLLNKYGGVTIYKSGKSYLWEVFYNES